MKKVLPAFLLLSVLLAGLVTGAGYALKSGIEDMTRNTVLNLMGPGESSVAKVSFNPLTRLVTVTGWSTTYSAGPEVCHAEIEQACGTITIRGLITCLPLLDRLFFDDTDIIPVIGNLAVKNCTYQGVSLLGRISGLSIKTVSLPYTLAKQYCGGARPPFAASVNGFGADHVLIEDCTASKIKRGKTASTLTIKSAEIDGLTGANAARMRCREIFQGSAKESWTADSLVLEDIRISPELLSELIALGRSPAGLVPSSFKKSLDANGRIFSHAEARNAGHTSKGLASPISASVCTLDWYEEEGQSVGLHIDNMSVPAENFPPDLKPGLAGMEAVHISGDAHIKNLSRPSCSATFALAGLADFKGSIDLYPDNLSFSGLKIIWQDHGLMSRLARCAADEPHLASMAIKTAVMSLCSGGSESDRLQCENMADFVDRPGTLTIAMRPGIVCPLFSWPALLSNFGSFFEVRTDQGSSSLTEQQEKPFLSSGSTGQ